MTVVPVDLAAERTCMRRRIDREDNQMTEQGVSLDVLAEVARVSVYGCPHLLDQYAKRRIINGGEEWITLRDAKEAMLSASPTTEQGVVEAENARLREALRHIAKTWPDSFAANKARAALTSGAVEVTAANRQTRVNQASSLPLSNHAGQITIAWTTTESHDL